MAIARSASRLEKLDRISIRILDLDLSTARPRLHLVAKSKSGLLEFGDEAWKIRDLQHDSIPAAWLLLLAIRHRPRAGRAGTTEQDLRVTEGDVRKCRQLLVLHCEPEMLRIKRDRSSHILYLIADAMNALDERVSVYAA